MSSPAAVGPQLACLAQQAHLLCS